MTGGRSPRATWAACLAAGLVAGACTADGGGDGGAAFAAESAGASYQELQRAGGSIDASRRTAIVAAADRVSPAVVTVNTLATRQVRPRSIFDSFLGPSARRAAGLGSGFIIDPAGVVVTNEHVVRGAERILVTLSDGRDFEAELLGADAITDVAVLRIRGEDLPAAPLGRSEGLIIGEWALAIGNPLGNRVANSEPTVTVGVVSAVGRHFNSSSQEEGFYLGMIQTDASINPGNSGGPLVNAVGEVIGVNSSILSRSGGSEGLGFAIPIDRALRIVDDLVRHGEVRRAWLGIDVEPEEADVFGRTRGVRVARVVEASPAARAGIRAGDRLVEAAGRRLVVPLDFEDVLLDLRAGDEIDIRVEDSPAPVTVAATSLPSVRAERITALQDLDAITVTPEVQAERGLSSDAGALIVSISPELQRQLGFREGDVIVQINNLRIRSAEDLATVFRQMRGAGQVRIVVERNGGYMIRPFTWR